SCMVPQRGPKVLVTWAPGTGLVHFGCGAAIAASSSLANWAPELPAAAGAPVADVVAPAAEVPAVRAGAVIWAATASSRFWISVIRIWDSARLTSTSGHGER